MDLDRIELADCGTPEALVAALLKQMPELPIPVPIAEIATALDITAIQEIESDGFEGGLLAFTDKSEGTILVNKRSDQRRRCFTIGHELGHFLNPWHQPQTAEGFRCTGRDMQRQSAKSDDRVARMEVEANRFAAGILLPAPHFRRDLARYRTTELPNIVDLARRYNTSKEATARRFVEICEDPCAIIISQNGKIIRFPYRTKNFPFLDIRPGQNVPASSITARYISNSASHSDTVEEDSATWLSSEHTQRFPLIYEQVLCQASGFRMTLLSLDESNDEDDEIDLEESYRPSFRW